MTTTGNSQQTQTTLTTCRPRSFPRTAKCGRCERRQVMERARQCPSKWRCGPWRCVYVDSTWHT
eukprot:scaffold20722_cov33-Tisochrysis_lutea.AAC.5